MGRLLAFARRSPAAGRVDLAIAVVVGVGAFFAVLTLRPVEESQASAPLPGLAGPARVIDGDTLDVRTVDGPIRVRLDGVDAFEAAQRCAGEPCGVEAERALGRMIDGRPVVCVAGGEDRYGRILARCRAGGEDIGGWMVEHGHAVAYRRYSHAYVSHEARARQAGRRLGCRLRRA